MSCLTKTVHLPYVSNHCNLICWTLPLFVVIQAYVLSIAIADAKDTSGSSIDLNLKNGGATLAVYIPVSLSSHRLLPRLLSRVYHESHVYLVEYDRSVSSKLYMDLDSFPAGNVYVRQAGLFTPKGVTHLLTMLDAMAFFIDRSEALSSAALAFDYFIHLTPTSYPTVPFPSLSRILRAVGTAYNWPSFFHFFEPSHLPFFSGEIKGHYVDLALSFNTSAPMFLASRRFAHPDASRRPFKSQIGRTTPLFIASRRLVKFAVDAPEAMRLLVALGETANVLERFFATLIQTTDLSKVGPVVRSASLHCSDSNAMDMPVDNARRGHKPSYQPNRPSLHFLYNTSEPCLFVGPFGDSRSSKRVKNNIDAEFGVFSSSAQMNDRDTDYAAIVVNKLKSVLEPIR